MGKNVLFVSYDGMSDPLGQSQVLPYLRGLSERGHVITIVSAEKSGPYKKLGDEIRVMLTASGISWKPVLFTNKIAGWSALKNFRRLKHEAGSVCRKNKIDIVHCRSYISALIGLQLKKRLGVKMIFDMRGFWADERVEGGLWNLENPFYKYAYVFFKKKEKQFLKNSDAVVSLTENARSEILSWKKLNISGEKIFVIPCCADLQLFSKKSVDAELKARLMKQLNIQQNDFVLSYSGSLGTWYLLDPMLDFFLLLLKKLPLAKFLFITQEHREKIISRALLRNISPDSIIVISAERKQMPVAISLSSISIFFIKNSFSKKASSPTKMGELMGMGIPLICNTGVGDVEKVISESSAGICIPQITKENLELAVTQIDVLLSISNHRISEAAEKYFSLTTAIEKYNHVYELL